jgi:uncharacterized protein YjbI with pentapeptide repeats
MTTMPRRDWIRAWIVAAVVVLALIVVVALGIWSGWDLKTLIGWKPLVDYINPKNATDRKDTVQVYALIVAGVIATVTAGVGLANLRLTRRNLQQQRELEEQRAQSAALQSYYEQIGSLLSDKELHSTERREIRELARGQTLTVLQSLEASRKKTLLAFLHGAQLIGSKNPAVELSGADLMYAKLQEAFLPHANLSDVNLHEANLRDSNLYGANLQNAILYRADLQGALLQEADLQGADLQEANLSWARLSAANLQGANLQGANLSGAELGAKRSEAIHVGLSGADLTDALGITQEQLSQTMSLIGATMPDGQKYEDWLKDKEGSGKDVENG